MPPRAPSAPSAYRRADQQAEDGAGPANRLGGTDRLCETLSSWRLLVGGLSPGASHHSFTTSSEEPPLSNFNSYRDISGDRTKSGRRDLFPMGGTRSDRRITDAVGLSSAVRVSLFGNVIALNAS